MEHVQFLPTTTQLAHVDDHCGGACSIGKELALEEFGRACVCVCVCVMCVVMRVSCEPALALVGGAGKKPRASTAATACCIGSVVNNS